MRTGEQASVHGHVSAEACCVLVRPGCEWVKAQRIVN